MSHPSPMTSSRSAARKRQTLRDAQASNRNNAVATLKVINAAPELEKAELYGIHDHRPAYQKLVGFAGRIFIETIPQWLAVGAMLGLIFGGCCSNVSRTSFPGLHRWPIRYQQGWLWFFYLPGF